MSRYFLAPAAQEDLVAIRDYYLGKGGHRVALQMLVEFTKASKLSPVLPVSVISERISLGTGQFSSGPCETT
jgi:hypothetical protein